MKKENKFLINLPGELSQKQIETLLPIFLLMQEKQMEEPKISHSNQIDINTWQFTRLENDDWQVNGYWTIK